MTTVTRQVLCPMHSLPETEPTPGGLRCCRCQQKIAAWQQRKPRELLPLRFQFRRIQVEPPYANACVDDELVGRVYGKAPRFTAMTLQREPLARSFQSRIEAAFALWKLIS